jgi:hypothetical protein
VVDDADVGITGEATAQMVREARVQLDGGDVPCVAGQRRRQSPCTRADLQDVCAGSDRRAPHELVGNSVTPKKMLTVSSGPSPRRT